MGLFKDAPPTAHPDFTQLRFVTPPRRERRGFSLGRSGVATDQPGP
jgi:hypothetical protein